MAKIDFTWTDGHKDTVATGTAMLGQLRITAQIVFDYNHDWLWRGTFTDQYQHGAVKNPRAKHERNVFKYFVPTNTVREHLKSMLEQGVELREARTKALEYVREDMRITADPENSGYYAVGVIVTVSILAKHTDSNQWVDLATDSLYGIEGKYAYVKLQDDEYIKEVVQECTDNALVMAHSTVKQIKEADNGIFEN
jgi:hypothetical protein